MSDETVKVRLLFADDGAYHHEELRVPGAALERYERLIDLFQEDPDVLRSTFVDLERLCAAWVVTDGD